MTRILVVYASKHKATAEIATKIGEVLQRSGQLQVDVRSVEVVKDLTLYDAVVLGSAVYVGQWQPAAANFLKEHEEDLTQRPTWLFSNGPTGQGESTVLLKGWAFPPALQHIVARIKPRDITLFHGNLDPTKLNFLERSTIKVVHAATGDSRDWTAIQVWAEHIAKALEPSATKVI